MTNDLWEWIHNHCECNTRQFRNAKSTRICVFYLVINGELKMQLVQLFFIERKEIFKTFSRQVNIHEPIISIRAESSKRNQAKTLPTEITCYIIVKTILILLSGCPFAGTDCHFCCTKVLNK